MSIVLIDATTSSMTVSWPETPGADRYVLEYRKSSDDTNEAYETLSTTLVAAQARKKHLQDDGTGFVFRAGVIMKGDNAVSLWVTHPEPFRLLSAEVEKQRMSAPSVTQSGNQALHISWALIDGASGYELQMRENVSGFEWQTIAASLSGTEVRKKNLTSIGGWVPVSSPAYRWRLNDVLGAIGPRHPTWLIRRYS